MKFADYYWEHPDLKPFTKQASAGQVLFRQHEEGTTMIIIVRGVAEIFASKNGKDLVVGFEEAGHFLGEKAIAGEGPHKRFFGARARTDLTYLELTASDLEKIAKENGALTLDIMRRMFQLAAERLDEANRLAEILRSSRNVDRLVHLILHFGRATQRSGAKGSLEVIVNLERIRYYIDMNDYEVEECFKELEKRRILVRETGGVYLIPDEKALLQSIPILREALPNIATI